MPIHLHETLAQHLIPTLRDMDVAQVAWPGGEEQRRQLAQASSPRLLMVAADAAPPMVADEYEDWVRLPARDDDIAARMRALSDRAAARKRPTVDEDGVLHVDGMQLLLPPVEARLTRHLLDKAGAVASRAELAVKGWPDGTPSRNALDVRILRLRRRIEPYGLMIRTVRHRGYLLDPTGTTA